MLAVRVLLAASAILRGQDRSHCLVSSVSLARHGFSCCAVSRRTSLPSVPGRSFEKLPAEEQALRAEAQLQLDAASADYRRAFELLDPQAGADLRFPLLVNQGLLRLEREEFGPAEADLNAAIRLDASRLEAFLALAQVYLKQGKPDQAFDQLSRAIALKPDMAALYRGRADVQLARKNPTAAERASALGDLEQAIKLGQPTNRVLASDHAKRARLLATRASRGRSPGGLRFRDQDRARL